MIFKDKLQALVYQDSATETATKVCNFRLTPTESAMLATLAQAYSLPASQIIRRLIRQAAIDYSHNGESIGLLKHNNVESA